MILRGNARQDVFFTAADCQYFFDLLAEGVTRFGYRVHAFCLMTNHLHLALQAGESSLSPGRQKTCWRVLACAPFGCRPLARLAD